MKCVNCGTQNSDDAKHCRRCGAVLPSAADVTVPVSPLEGDPGGTQPLSAELGDTGGTRPLSDTGPNKVPEVPASSDQAHTRPLPRSRMFFEPLPERALLADDRYKIVALLEETPMLNKYSAVSRRALIECKQCGFARNNYGDQFCLQCGASLANLEPIYPKFIIKETLAPDAIAVERRLAEMELHHGGALLPIETFSAMIAGTRRVYVVLPEPSPFTAGRLPSSPETTDIVNWGVQLADALAYLHKNNVSFGMADLEHVSIGGKAARWFNFSSARIQTPGTRNRQVYTNDVVTLAASLFALLTGKPYAPDIVVSPPGLNETFQLLFTGKVTTAVQLADRLRDVVGEIRRPASYDLRVGRLSDVGQVRQINEDALLTLEVGRVHRSIGAPLGLYAVCDGMGGHSAGDVASGLAISALAQHAAETLLPGQLNSDGDRLDLTAWLREAVSLANKTVNEQRQLAGTNMGTTLVMAFIANGQARIANVGDSRAYLINATGIKQLTVDHSLVQRLIETKQLTVEEARTHPQRNVIYKNLGDRPTVEPDLLQVDLQPGDQLLLCSDGLSGYVEDDDMFGLIRSAHSPQEACRKLIDAANTHGGPDNITAILIQVETLS
jgi:serine/threonine protein phosphatase PrpC